MTAQAQTPAPDTLILKSADRLYGADHQKSGAQNAKPGLSMWHSPRSDETLILKPEQALVFGIYVSKEAQGMNGSMVMVPDSARLRSVPIQAADAPVQGPVYSSFWLFSFFVKLIFILIVIVVLVYTLRHYLFTWNRLFGRQAHMYLDVTHGPWPTITVLVAAHNEEKVIADSLRALMAVDYPLDKLRIVPVNDRSNDGTFGIIEHFAQLHPGLFFPFHRNSGKPGKAAALKDVMALIDDDIIVVFDADYIPGKGLIKQLVAPFFDPEVGATMGRVVPINPDTNLLTRLLDMERAGGYQVDQQARANLGLTAQYGGTVGGVRRKALDAVGGWSDDILAEDTDITFRLRCAGWKVIYQNRSECYEEVPEEWPVRIRQLRRWARGHHQVLLRQWRAVLGSPALRFYQKLDALLLLGIFSVSPLIILGWLCALILFYYGHGIWQSSGLMIMSFSAFAGLGNFAAFFEIAAAVFLDGRRSRLALMPLGMANFLVSVFEISAATLEQTWATLRKKNIHWDKTTRYRVQAIPETDAPNHETAMNVRPPGIDNRSPA